MYRSYRKKAEKRIEKVIGGWMYRTIRGIEGQAKKLAPVGMGTMRRTIRAYFNWPVSTVVVNVPYARFVEGYPKITRKHFHSWRNDPTFRNWARRRGFDTSQAGGGLLTWGYKKPFFSNAVTLITPRAMADLRRLRI